MALVKKINKIEDAEIQKETKQTTIGRTRFWMWKTVGI